jgi:hypothetical protein
MSLQFPLMPRRSAWRQRNTSSSARRSSPWHSPSLATWASLTAMLSPHWLGRSALLWSGSPVGGQQNDVLQVRGPAPFSNVLSCDYLQGSAKCSKRHCNPGILLVLCKEGKNERKIERMSEGVCIVAMFQLLWCSPAESVWGACYSDIHGGGWLPYRVHTPQEWQQPCCSTASGEAYIICNTYMFTTPASLLSQ